MIAIDTTVTAKPVEWLSPKQLANLSSGLLSDRTIRGIVDRAIEDPESKLQSGVHYVRLQGRLKPRYKVSAKILDVL